MLTLLNTVNINVIDIIGLLLLVMAKNTRVYYKFPPWASLLIINFYKYLVLLVISHCISEIESLII